MKMVKDEHTGEWSIVERWTEADIMHQAEYSYGIELTPDQSYKILELIMKSHNANIGINWDVIDNAIQQLT
jgi:uncharacterized protein YpuA (DUF1002 family)